MSDADPREMLSGVFAPVVTPFQDDELRCDWLAENLRKLAASGLRGYLALGSNGEFMSLDDGEALEVLRVFSEEGAGKTVMAGAGRESTRGTIEFACRAAEVGADFVSVLTPHYFGKRITQDVLLRHFREVADHVPVPVVLYNAPGFTGVELSPQTVRRLAVHENIVGMKDSSKAGMSGYLAATRGNAGFHVLAGSANFFFTALVCGAVGGVLSLANCLPGACCELYEACRAGDIDRARRLHFRLFRLNRNVSGRGGVAAVKAAMEMLGYRGGDPRRPLLPLAQADRQEMRRVFEEEGVL